MSQFNYESQEEADYYESAGAEQQANDEAEHDLLTKGDQEFIIKQQEKPMEPQEENWTSVDAYYRGFHIKKSWGKNVSRVVLMAEIDDLLKAGFKPSWNDDTNKASVVNPTPQTPAQKYVDTKPVDDELLVPCKECGGATTYREGVSKTTGKPWKAYFCDDKSKQCKPYFAK